ncbi:hypothetical protein M433DRAFT_57667 [Acidomyces richmondensis BFW]|nr:hypothetical protein M433DRAFT_57667 [Acidomyces richmondensis BFW]
MDSLPQSHGKDVLPADLFHVVFAQLAASAQASENQEVAKADFAALCNCIYSSKYLASAGALSSLYRCVLGTSPVKDGGSENLSFAEQHIMVMKWSILWRSIILSALGKTLYPYCRHLRDLDLRDLGNLLGELDESRDKAKVAKQFFSGDLAQFHFVSDAPGKGRVAKLSIKKIIQAVGNEITQRAPLLEELSEPTTSDLLSSALPAWASRLTHLRSLDIWDGKLLADETIRNLLHVYCPQLNHLKLYLSTVHDSDHHLASFINGMPENKLTRFENISSCNISLETCLAFNHHSKSLVNLKLFLSDEGILALGALQGCTMLETLDIGCYGSTMDLKDTQNDAYLEITQWLKNCDHLKAISFQNVISAPDLVLPVLLNPKVKLRALQINATESAMYVVKDHHDFHQALAKQTSLEDLMLRADPEPMTRDDLEILMNTFCSLQNLQEINLFRIADYFTNEHIELLGSRLTNLDTFYVGGYGISDRVLDSFVHSSRLKTLTFAGISSFTVDGILDFIGKLGSSNQGLLLSVDNAEPETMISEEGQNLIREAMATKLDGRFEYQPLRGKFPT